MGKTTTVWTISIILALWRPGATPVFARSMAATDAKTAVAGWLADDPAPMGAALGRGIAGVDTFGDEDGRPLFHVVYVEPLGIIVVSADDSTGPIIAFAEADTFDASPANPLAALVRHDLPRRLDKSDPDTAGTVQIQEAPRSQAKWRYLMARANAGSHALAVQGLETVSDVRVPPLIQTRWSQGDVCGAACYNYYTPKNHPSGCVATAMAQLLYYHRHPAEGIDRQEFDIEIRGVPSSAYTRGGNGKGGPYAWDQMVLKPDCNATNPQRRAIGALCYDTGVTVNMDYAPGGSAADSFIIADALRNTFGFANAVKGANDGEDIGPDLMTMLNPNLDAGYPAILGIIGDEGHAVVVDGYGYDGSPFATLYHHLNMGWSGYSNAWYDLPDVTSFDAATACTYNIFPTDTGEIISGRVKDVLGRPLSGVLVQAVQRSPTQETTSNARGIYALAGLPPGAVLTIRAQKPGVTFASQSVQTGISADWRSTSGNRWNIDLTGTLTADRDGDIDVDLRDFALLAYHWRRPAGDSASQPTYTGEATDFRDLAELAGTWLTGATVRTFAPRP